ncbi:molybdopterin-dependent oxidoreductase, partial [bacterium]|nr:molybdopterin-dependent oxidoreductase [bacterium]
MSDAESEKIITTSCAPHCGGGCILRVHVEDGVIHRIETDDGDHTQVRACARGRSWRQRIYHPDRLEYPLKRTGARGEGKFERISWDEAFDTIVAEIKRIAETYGPGSLVYWISGGDQGLFDTWERMGDIFCGVGGYTRPWGLHSYEGAIFAELATFGSAWTHGTRDDLVNSRLIIMWGWDPSTTIHDTNTAYFLAQAREGGARIISIDPRYTTSTATFSHQWIPIQPGTDTAMLVAMANVMVTENLQDQAFLDTYTVGFEPFRDYLLGREDGVEKTPKWAEDITGVPAATIRELAREYATTKPAALIAGIGPGRSAFGEQYHRVAITLAAMTGNIGISGGSCGGKSWGPPILMENNPDPKAKPNSVQDQVENLKRISNRSEYIYGEGVINLFRLTDGILKGKAGGYPADYKFLYLNNSNVVNQWPNTNKTVEAFEKLDFIVIEEQF